MALHHFKGMAPSSLLKSLLAFALLIGSANAFAAPVTIYPRKPQPPIVPRPKEQTITLGANGFQPAPGMPIIVDTNAPEKQEVLGIAQRFAQWARPVIGKEIPVRSGSFLKSRQALVLITSGKQSRLGDEGYILSVTPSLITIRANKPAGLFYGLQTLRQLFPPSAESGVRIDRDFRVAPVTIDDQPRFPVRSVMLDSSRHMQSIDFLKKTIDQMAYHKLNRFHWHLTDDQGWRLEIKKYPRLTSVGAWRTEAGGQRYGGFYTQAQVRDLVAYAKERYVTIQPEIEMPAHIQSALASYPELACTPKPFVVSTASVSPNGVWTPDVLCVGKPTSFSFVTDVLTEVMALFPSKEIHIGGDECDKIRWKVCPHCQARIKKKGLKSEQALQNEFTQRLAAFLESKGRKLQGWNEIEEGGPLPRSVVVQMWNDASTLSRSADAGRDIVYSLTKTLYLDQDPAALTTERVYGTEPLPWDASPITRQHLRGLEACLWTEHRDGDATTDDYLWPRVAALSEAAWSAPERRNWEDFRQRIVTRHLDRMARLSLTKKASPAQITARRRHLYVGGEFAVGFDAGRWNPAMMSETTVIREWEVTKLLNRPGEWSVQPHYTEGSHGIAVSEIALIRRDAGDETGSVVAKDTHEAWIGSAVRKPRFHLPLTSLDKNARYFLRVLLRSQGGTDSNGTLTLYAPPE